MKVESLDKLCQVIFQCGEALKHNDYFTSKGSKNQIMSQYENKNLWVEFKISRFDS